MSSLLRCLGPKNSANLVLQLRVQAIGKQRAHGVVLGRFVVPKRAQYREFGVYRRALQEKVDKGNKMDKVDKVYKVDKQPSNTAFQSSTAKIYSRTKELHTKMIKEPLKKIIPAHENIYTVPNFLTMTRLVAAPVIGYFIVNQNIVAAASLFVYSSITDFVDGMIARKYNLKTIVGSIIDPMADKLLMIISTATLTYVNQFPLYLAVLILGKDIIMGISAVFVRYKTLPAPKTFARYWDFSIPSVKVFPTTISKYNTAFQMVYITLAIFKPVVTPVIPVDQLDFCISAFEYFGYFVGFTTILGGGSYLVSKDAVKLIKQ